DIHDTVETETKTSEQNQNLLKKRFILEKVLGAGGMGVVYKAKDLVKVEAGDKDPYVAIKVLTEEFKEHPEAFVALQRESRKTQRIAHPNIVNVHDFDKDKSQVFMTMEYLEGKPLDQLIRQYKSTGLPTDDAVTILTDLCHALSYAHKQEIIHSDFKPGNIFVTDKGVTKIFDFGIARAVAKAEQYEENLDDKTIFDAGDLGALTPAYASLEMLDGLEPDVRDDIYALGCVAYELLTGSHPFNKVPADEAQRQKLKPKRINNISRRLWKAIEKSLSFKREDRLATPDEFLTLITKKDSVLKIPSIVIAVGFVIFVTYFQFIREQPLVTNESEIRNELEYTLRIENYRNSIDELRVSRSFTESWEASLWNQVQGVGSLLENSEKWLESSSNEDFKQSVKSHTTWYESSQQSIYNDYLQQIQMSMQSEDFSRAQALIANAHRYVQDQSQLDQQSSQLEGLIVQQKQRLAEEQEKARLAEENAKKRRAEEAKIAAQKSALKKKQDAAAEKRKQFDIALSNVEGQINCTSSNLNMRNFDTAIKKLRSIDSARYNKLEEQITRALASCITKIGKEQPEKAQEFKQASLRLFKKNPSLSAVAIVPRDPCSPSLAGLGARGKRATCKDPIAKLGFGPDLVVIPAKRGIKAFAIGKYEVSVADMNLYCKNSKKCNEVGSGNEGMPSTNINVEDAKGYLSWLSKTTGKKYRLPSKNEWIYAAKSKRTSLDPNRNCKLRTRGITKGDKLIRASTGAQNEWGIVNYVGNASEWVYDKGRKLVAVGGSYNMSMENCNISSVVEHSGKADSFTGFRVLRELK
ncbi:MAG: protein kinase, partial [Kangiellaceae bacterium]|nr:protein kinase [Kangiellaceae bacterium]